VCNRFSEEYISAYQKLVRVSEPEEDYDGRVDLYKLFVACTSTVLMYTSKFEYRPSYRRFNTHVSALFFDNMTDPPRAVSNHSISICVSLSLDAADGGSRMLNDLRDLKKRYG
jgi:hypothetical protein